MAHIWTKLDVGEWQPVALVADVSALTVVGPAPQDAARVPPDADSTFFNVAAHPSAGIASTVLLRRVATAREETWTLLAGPSAHPLVNGLPIPHGIVVLSDRDELRWHVSHDPSGTARHPLFFSTERLATVTPYQAGDRRGSCPRCKQLLTVGDAAVRCPRCGLWHHATDELPCWTYGEHCAACQQLTALDAGFQWTPEEL